MKNMNELISQMTIREKAEMLSGKDFWHLKSIKRLGIEQVMVSDGPHGIRKQNTAGDHIALNESVPATCFPAACATACSFDRELIFSMGMLLGEECQAEELSVLLGPGANIKRSPLCGRNFEYFSEDPYLTGELAAAYIQGVQSQNVGTSLKHFALNNQEHRRMTVSVNADERTMREIYLAGFETAVKKGKPWTVMCSYNRVNGTYASENPLLLRDILKNEWGFEGYTITDWGACNDHIQGVIAGLDLEMPYSGPENDEKLIRAIEHGEVDIAVVDEAVKRILTVVFRYMDHRRSDAVYHKEKHHQCARRIASESIVLLKNAEHILPLNTQQSVAFIGQYASHPRYQGNGSSQIHPTRMESAMDAVSSFDNVRFAQGFDDTNQSHAQTLLDEAVALAKICDVAVLFVGLPSAYESEGFDRDDMDMPPYQNKLIQAVAQANSDTVVVLHNGAPVSIPWLSEVKGVVEVYLGGQAGGGATVDVLFGNVNPSGKLAETFPIQLEDTPSYLNFPGDGDEVNYREGIFVGYRYYDKKKKDVRFPFGFGLSYTTFAYSNLQIDSSAFASNHEMKVTAAITNTGDVEGKEIVQLYIARSHKGISRPIRELKDFAKIHLKPNETKIVSFSLNHRAFAYYETAIHDWYIENGEYVIEIGASSRDIRLIETVSIRDSRPLKKKITNNSTFADICSTARGKALVSDVIASVAKTMGNTSNSASEENEKLFRVMIDSMPLHSIKSFAKGALSDNNIEKIVKTMNEET